MTETRVWLTQSAYQRFKSELSELARQRTEAPGEQVGDSAAAWRDRENRIRRLQEILRSCLVAKDPPDDGVAEPGMVLTVRYEDTQDTETYLLAHDEEGAHADGVSTCSPDSPLGAALLGHRQGEKVGYVLPNGLAMEVTLLRAAPYRGQVGPRR